MDTYRPAFSEYDLVISNYNGEPWSSAAMVDFEEFVAGGGGFVSVHAANNAFPEWTAYNEMIGGGGWGDRDGAERSLHSIPRRQVRLRQHPWHRREPWYPSRISRRHPRFGLSDHPRLARILDACD